MPTLELEGIGSIKIDDSFTRLPSVEQGRVVEEIVNAVRMNGHSPSLTTATTSNASGSWRFPANVVQDLLRPHCPSFDFQGALNAGYSPVEIVEFLRQQPSAPSIQVEYLIQVAAGLGALLAGLWGLWIGLRIAWGKHPAPQWVRWPLVFLGGASVFWIVVSLTAPGGPAIDAIIPHAARLLTLGLVVALVVMVNRLGDMRRDRADRRKQSKA